MKGKIAGIVAGFLVGSMMMSGTCMADNWKEAPLSFSGSGGDITGGTISWDEDSHEWKAVFPSDWGEITLSGDYEEDGSMTVVEDSTGGHAGNDLPHIQEVFEKALDGWRSAPLAFTGGCGDITGGTISWNVDTKEWNTVFPSNWGEITMSGTYDDSGMMTIEEDSTGGHAGNDLPAIQEVFVRALQGIYLDGTVSIQDEEKPDNDLSREIAALEEVPNNWKGSAVDIARTYDPEIRNRDTIFYGASNFTFWYTMEEDLAPYSVQNHAFGGSTDKDLYYYAPYLLYPYNPQIVFFQTGSNDYVESTAETDELKIEEAMTFKKQMFAEFHEKLPDAKFVIMSGILLPGRSEYVDMTLKINDELKVFCEETDYMYFIDAEGLTYDREAGSFVDGVEDLFVADQIHLAPESRITWAQNWMLPMLEELDAPVAGENKVA